MAEAGIDNILRDLGILDGAPKPAKPPRIVEIADPQDSAYATTTGLFDRAVCAGKNVARGDLLGRFHHITEPERGSVDIRAPASGLILAHTNRGMVKRGELLALIVRDVEDGA